MLEGKTEPQITIRSSLDIVQAKLDLVNGSQEETCTLCLQLLTRAQCEQSEKLERKDMSCFPVSFPLFSQMSLQLHLSYA